jgi:hypothetical protein
VPSLASFVPEGRARAEVKDGFLIGHATEQIKHRQDGGLSIVRERRYRRVKHPDTGKVYELPEPFRAHAKLEISSNVRLIRAETRARFSRSVDAVLGKDVLSDAAPRLFEIDRVTLVALADGKQLERRAYLGKQEVEHDRFDYDSDAVPIEVLALFVAAQLQAKKKRFDLDLLVGDSSHGVSAEVTHTSDLRRFAKGYPVPRSRLRPEREVAVVDLWLSSPVKYLFFPHHFYVVAEASNPAQLLMFWGGDPDEPLHTLRLP